ncbi:MAG: corrinoid protein [Eubacteriales bacterium]|jgi:corrinoid protein of di/trimethylamine methyltransferase|nr:corrinoid protein [Eubacteriales bacterium]
MSILNQISEKLQAGKAKEVKELVSQAIEEGIKAKDILDKGLLDGMNVIGEKFKVNEVYVPEVLIAARAMKSGVEVLKPHLVSDDIKPAGRICIGTVKGDLHDIGKNLVKMMMEGKGIEVIDLGVDVSPEQFVKTAKEQDCTVICCSALLTTTMGAMKDVVDLCVAEGIRDKVKIMIGGAPITDAYCASIGADAYSADAASGADVALKFCLEAQA